MSARSAWWRRALSPVIAVLIVLVMLVVVGREAAMDWRSANPPAAPLNSDGIAEVDGVGISLEVLKPFDFVELSGSNVNRPYVPPEGWSSWAVQFMVHELSPDTEVVSLTMSLLASDGRTYEQSRQLPYSILPDGSGPWMPDEPGPLYGAFLLPDGVTPVSARISAGPFVPQIWSFDYDPT